MDYDKYYAVHVFNPVEGDIQLLGVFSELEFKKYGRSTAPPETKARGLLRWKFEHGETSTLLKLARVEYVAVGASLLYSADAAIFPQTYRPQNFIE